MDNREDQPIRNQSRDTQSQDEAALVVFRRLVSDSARPAARVLARAGDLELSLGDPAAGALHLSRAADAYTEAGLHNLALALCHRLLQLDPTPTEEYLRLGELSAAQGYARDARLGYLEYAERTADAGDADAARAALQAYLRFAPADAAVQRRLAQLSGGAFVEPEDLTSTTLDTPPSEAPLPSSAPLEGLEGNEPIEAAPEPGEFEIAPLEGLESHRADEDPGAAAFPEEPAEALPLLGSDGLVSDHGLPPDDFASEPAGELEAPELPEKEEDDLPLLGSDALPLLQSHSPPDYVDLGALVLSGGDADLPELRSDPAQSAGVDAGELAEILELFAGRVARGIETNDAASHYDLGLAFKEMGLYDDAIAHLQAALRSGASPVATLEVLGECFIESRDAAFATRLLERAARLQGAEPAELVGVLYWLGRGYEELRDTERARSAYERLVEQSSDFRDAEARLAAL